MSSERGWRAPWHFAPPSETCQTWDPPSTRVDCGEYATHAYPAMGGGYHSMCERHATKHLDYCVTIAGARDGQVPPLFEERPRAEG